MKLTENCFQEYEGKILKACPTKSSMMEKIKLWKRRLVYIGGTMARISSLLSIATCYTQKCRIPLLQDHWGSYLQSCVKGPNHYTKDRVCFLRSYKSFLCIYVFIEVSLTYNVKLVSVVQHSDSAALYIAILTTIVAPIC